MRSSDDATEHADMVRRIAVRTMASFGMHDRIEDAVNEGHAALLEARASFEPDRLVPFEAYASFRIRYAVLEAVRKMSDLPRTSRRVQRAMQAADIEAEQAGIERAQRGEPARPLAALGALEAVMNTLGTIFTAAEVADSVQHGRTEDDLVTEMDAARLKRVLPKLDDDERRVLDLVYFEDQSLQDASVTMRVSRATAYRLHNEALASLRVLLV